MSFDIFNTLFTNIWSIFLVIAFFGGSIFIHELGHFLAARKRGLQVDRFSIGFGPKIFGWKKDGVEYRISLLPLGGYVALPQLADLRAIEGNGESKKLPPISYTDKVIVSVMGAVFNLIFAFGLAIILWGIGQPISATESTTTIGHVEKVIHINETETTPGPAYAAGLLPGDIVTHVDGISVPDFSSIRKHIIMGTGRDKENNPQVTLTVERDGQQLDINVTPTLVKTNPLSGDYIRAIGISPSMAPLKIGSIMPNSPADQAGLEKGDIITDINGKTVYSLITLNEHFNNQPNEPVTLKVLKDRKLISLKLQPEQVPYTRPIAEITVNKTANNVIKVIPQTEQGFESELANPSLKANLVLFSISKEAQEAFSSLREGAILTHINNTPISSLGALVKAAEENANNLTLKTQQEELVSIGQIDSVSITPPQTIPMIGIMIENETVLTHISPIAQFKENIVMTFQTLKSLLSPNSDIHIQHMMGPPGIIKTLHTFSSTNIRLVLWFVIVLNINLAILNLLPIPVLDGGHIMFATIGKLRGKDLPIKFVSTAQSIFMICLFSLMLYVSFFDVRRWQGTNKMDSEYEKSKSLLIERTFSKK